MVLAKYYIDQSALGGDVINITFHDLFPSSSLVCVLNLAVYTRTCTRIFMSSDGHGTALSLPLRLTSA